MLGASEGPSSCRAVHRADAVTFCPPVLGDDRIELVERGRGEDSSREQEQHSVGCCELRWVRLIAADQPDAPRFRECALQLGGHFARRLPIADHEHLGDSICLWQRRRRRQLHATAST